MFWQEFFTKKISLWAKNKQTHLLLNKTLSGSKSLLQLCHVFSKLKNIQVASAELEEVISNMELIKKNCKQDGVEQRWLHKWVWYYDHNIPPRMLCFWALHLFSKPRFQLWQPKAPCPFLQTENKRKQETPQHQSGNSSQGLMNKKKNREEKKNL